ncbi:MAG: hypothetical protein L0216_02275 [Planctomycetales bacterium]|nr:hypothetical protein [Planctomycetales bacterium]
MSFRGLARVLAASTLLAGAGAGCSRSAAAGVGAEAPSLAGVDWWPGFALDRMPTTFGEAPLQGQVVVLEFFASW